MSDQALLPFVDEPTDAELLFGAAAAGDDYARADDGWVWTYFWEHHGHTIPIPDVRNAGPAPTCPACGRAMFATGRIASAPPPLCYFCSAPATIWKAHGNPLEKMYAVVPVPGKPGRAMMVDAHVGCVVKMLGHATKVQGFKARRAHPDCGRCGKAWDDHDRLGYETRSCPDADGILRDGTQLYERAPGLIGPEPPAWLGEQVVSSPARKLTPTELTEFELDYLGAARPAPQRGAA